MKEKVYDQICQNIRFTDDISFKLLGLVPLFSGTGVVVALLKGQALLSPGVVLVSLFGAFVTLGLFRWELRNIKNCNDLIARASAIEPNDAKQYSSSRDAPGLVGRRIRIGKTEAEKFIYAVSIVVWLALPWVTRVATESDSDNLVAASGEPVFYVYWISTGVIGVLLLLSLFASTDASSGD